MDDDDDFNYEDFDIDVSEENKEKNAGQSDFFTKLKPISEDQGVKEKEPSEDKDELDHLIEEELASYSHNNTKKTSDKPKKTGIASKFSQIKEDFERLEERKGEFENLFETGKLDKSYNFLINENKELNGHLKQLNSLLDEVLEKQKFDKKIIQPKSKKQEISAKTAETNSKLIEIYKKDYQKLEAKYSKLSNPKYEEELDNELEEIERRTTQLINENKKLKHSQKINENTLEKQNNRRNFNQPNKLKKTIDEFDFLKKKYEEVTNRIEQNKQVMGTSDEKIKDLIEKEKMMLEIGKLNYNIDDFATVEESKAEKVSQEEVKQMSRKAEILEKSVNSLKKKSATFTSQVEKRMVQLKKEKEEIAVQLQKIEGESNAANASIKSQIDALERKEKPEKRNTNLNRIEEKEEEPTIDMGKTHEAEAFFMTNENAPIKKKKVDTGTDSQQELNYETNVHSEKKKETKGERYGEIQEEEHVYERKEILARDESEEVVNKNEFVLADKEKSEPILTEEEVLSSNRSDVVNAKEEVLLSKRSEPVLTEEEVLPSKKSDVVNAKEEVLSSKRSEAVSAKEEKGQEMRSEGLSYIEDILESKKSEIISNKEEVLPSKRSEVKSYREEVLPSKRSELVSVREDLDEVLVNEQKNIRAYEEERSTKNVDKEEGVLLNFGGEITMKGNVDKSEKKRTNAVDDSVEEVGESHKIKDKLINKSIDTENCDGLEEINAVEKEEVPNFLKGFDESRFNKKVEETEENVLAIETVGEIKSKKVSGGFFGGVFSDDEENPVDKVKVKDSKFDDLFSDKKSPTKKQVKKEVNDLDDIII